MSAAPPTPALPIKGGGGKGKRLCLSLPSRGEGMMAALSHLLPRPSGWRVGAARSFLLPPPLKGRAGVGGIVPPHRIVRMAP